MASSGWDFQVNIFDSQYAGVALDQLSVQVQFAVDLECVFVALLLDFAGGLDFGVLEAAMGAEEGHDYDFAEEGDFGKEESGDALEVRLADVLVDLRDSTDIRMAIHAKTFYLIDDLGIVFIASLLGVGDLPTHIFEKVFRKTEFWVCHDV